MSYVRLLESAAMLLFLPRRGAGRTPKGQDTRGHRLYVTRLLVRHRHPENFQEPSFGCRTRRFCPELSAERPRQEESKSRTLHRRHRESLLRKRGGWFADTSNILTSQRSARKGEGSLRIRYGRHVVAYHLTAATILRPLKD